MAYRSADHALERYLRLRSSLQDVRGQDLSLGSGWADTCARSGCAGERRETNGEMRCHRCGDPWHFRPPALVRSGTSSAHRTPTGPVATFRPESGRAVQPSGSSARGSGVGTASRLHGRLAEMALLGVVLGERPGRRPRDPAAAWRMSASAWEDHLTVWVAYATGAGTLLEVAELHLSSILRAGERPNDRGASAVVHRARDVVEARLDARLLLARAPTTRYEEGRG